MIRAVLRTYLHRVQLFQRNARLYLLYIAGSGVAAGILGLLFNFYVLSLGFDEALLGRLLSVNNTAALLAALPAGYLSDRLGRKRALLLAAAGSTVAVAGIVLWQTPTALFALYTLSGLCQSLGSVTLAPFLMENSAETERTYLFSASFGVQMLAVTLGYWLGGQLPGWISGAPAAAAVYAQSLLVVVALGLCGLLPLAFIQTAPGANQTDRLAPFRYAAQHPALLGKLIAPLMITTLGAGLFVPFMNVFFRQTHHSSDAVIGSLFAAGSFAMGLGLLAAPPLAERYGSINAFILTQALSIPFMALLGFAPWFGVSAAAYLIRLLLMNMTIPVYQAFAMAQVSTEARGVTAALINMGYSFGYAISPALSGQIQVWSGFGPIFGVAILTYVIAIGLYWYFWKKAPITPSPVHEFTH